MPSSLTQRMDPALGRSTASGWLTLTSALLLCLAIPDQAWCAEDVPALRVAVSRAISPPFVVWREQQASAGIDVEIAQELAAGLKTRVEWVALPRLRIEGALLSGEADIACNLSPLQTLRSDSLPQSSPLFDLQDMLSAHPDATGVDALEQLPNGAVIGTLQGQAYPQLDALFLQGRVKRDDALDEERMLRKLAKDRHPYGISSRQTLSWFSNPGGEERLASWRLLLGSRPYRCTVSPRGRFEVKQLLAGLEQLLSSGRIDQIVAARTAPALAVVVSVRSPVRDVSRSALIELFMGKRQNLMDEVPTLPVMSAGPERQQFFAAILKREPAQYRASWATQQFGGRRRAPTELSSAEATKTYLQRHTEAIGYLPLTLVDSSLRIVYLP
ncbi:substrate-binding periplasmic protein [Paucibacter sp. DJ2R-2]|uniref:substrate-binding periplasmic protein n=1 Tax=Paucibacter sp. DJ2R-2 TaxID=2893558 RepID=UPI0021E5160A|nr:ABC transporter substrate-binding protein [Paucibacter sp. DJ2R-2]MCV2420829.1 ABC transporter substrate-binding protein [Paucibacter sp. DJ4R-1]MCV2440028.1 ABC transporter substrate-binding protein [Paucibacter sp. DJ2R-2]